MKKFNVVCIIEDNPASVFWIRELMEEVDFTNKILVYNDGKSAIDQLTDIVIDKTQAPDLIFLDLNMPVMDGWEFLEEFIKITPSKKILIYILTSSVDPEDTIKAKKYEAISGYIVKPITEDDLKKILKNNEELFSYS